jgi:hypothetical protein
MAVKKEEILNEYISKPLSVKEFEVVSIVEKLIDEEIKNQISVGEKIIYIELDWLNFNYEVEGIKITSDMRPNKMKDELERRYRESGWEIRVEYDDGLDGNLSGTDYWVLY